MEIRNILCRAEQIPSHEYGKKKEHANELCRAEQIPSQEYKKNKEHANKLCTVYQSPPKSTQNVTRGKWKSNDSLYRGVQPLPDDRVEWGSRKRKATTVHAPTQANKPCPTTKQTEPDEDWMKWDSLPESSFANK
jgi:hypothetical protein